MSSHISNRFYQRTLCHRTQATVWDLLHYNCLEEWCATRLCARPFLFLASVSPDSWSRLIAGALCEHLEVWYLSQRVCFNTVVSGLTRGADTISHRWWLATWMWVIVQTTWPSIPRIQKEAVMDFRQLRSHTRSPHYSSHQIKWLAQLLDNSCTTQVDQGTNVAGELFKERQGSFGLYYCIVQSFQLAHPSGAVSRAMNI